MTTTATLTPQIIGQAENAHKPLMDRALAGTGATFAQWVALKLTTVSGASIDRNQLAGRMSGALKIENPAAQATIAELIASELLETRPDNGSSVGLTSAGQTLYHRISTAIEEITARVYGNIPADDLATAARVLTVITAQANAEAAA